MSSHAEIGMVMVGYTRINDQSDSWSPRWVITRLIGMKSSVGGIR